MLGGYMRKFFSRVLPILALSVLFIFPTTNNVAYGYGGADGSSGTGFGGDGSHSTYNKALVMHWEIFTDADTDFMRDWNWKPAEFPNLLCCFLSDGRYTPRGVPRVYGWNAFMRDWEIGKAASDVFDEMYEKGLPDEKLLQQAKNEGYEENRWIERPTGPRDVTCGFHWWERERDAKLLDKVWCGTRRIKITDGGNKIIYVSGGLGEQLDHRSWGLRKQFYKGRDTPVEYWFKTNPKETVATRHLDAQTLRVIEHVSCDEKSCTVWYESKGPFFYTKDFTYNTITPTIKQEPFKPWNLNRNGYATIDDISSQYAHAKLPIELDVNNNQGVYDNSPLKALDINNDTFFKFKFTNGYLGMPSVFNWTNPPGTPPGILNNGTWEDAGSGGYANGRNANADKDGLYRYNVKLHMSMSPNTKKPFVDTSSINFNGSEFTTSEEALQRPPWAGGELSTRFTYADTYWTDNNKEGSKFPAWWVNTYTMGRFYEYGSEWHGLVTLSGIEDPNNVMYGTGQSTGYDSYKITIDANKQQKGLYVGYASANFEQPIITGTWEVKTVAGYVN